MSLWFKRIVGDQIFIEDRTTLPARVLSTGLSVTLFATVAGLLLLVLFRQPLWAAALLLVALFWEGGTLVAARFGNLGLASMHFTYGMGVLVLAATYAIGGVRQASFSAFIIPVFLCGLLLGRRHVISLSIIGIIIGAVLFSLEGEGLLPRTSLANPVVYIWLIESVNLAGAVSVFLTLGLSHEMLSQRTRSEIDERKKVQESYTRSTERLEILHQIDKAILENNSTEAIAQASLNLVDGLIPLQRANIVEFDFNKKEAIILAVFNPGRPKSERKEKLTLEEYGLVPELKPGSIQLMGNPPATAQEKFLGGFTKSMNSGSYASIPLWANGVLVGALNLASKSGEVFTDDHLEVAKEVANSVAIAIRSYRMQQNIQQTARRLAGLYDTALVISSELEVETLVDLVYRQVQALFNPDAFVITLLTPGDKDLMILLAMESGKLADYTADERLPVDGSSLSGWVVKEKKSLLIRDMDKDALSASPKHGMRPAKAWLGVPLIARSQVIGAMSIQSFTPDAFDEDQQRLLLSLGSLVAISLKNAEYFSETSRWLHKLQSLHDIDEAITTQDDIKIIFEVILQNAMSQLNVDAAEILTWDPNLNILHHSARKGFRIRLSTSSFTHLDDRLDFKRMLERGIVAIPDLNKTGPGSAHAPPSAPGEDFAAYFAVPLIAKGELQGILETYFRRPTNPDSEWLDFLETLAGQVAIAINNATLVKNLQNKNLELSLAYDKTLEGWSHALDMRDMETEGHSQRVTELSILLASELGVPKDEIVHIRRGALLHDIGKIGIPDNILHKPANLTADEQLVMRRHPELAYQLLSTIPYLHPALAIPYCHHEKWDGSGYPRHLKGEEIPLQARIFSVVDVWDALRSNRLYRQAWMEDKTLDYINQESGKSFDPRVVEAFFSMIRRRIASSHI